MIFPIPLSRRISAAEIAREIIFQEEVEKVYTDIKASGYNQQKVMNYIYSNSCEYALEALIQATKNGEINVNKRNGREIWKGVVRKYSSKPFSELSKLEYSTIRKLNNICEPPWWRTLGNIGIGCACGFYALFSMSGPSYGARIEADLCHKLDMKHLRNWFDIEKDRKG